MSVHPLDKRTLLWMKARENETGRPVSPQGVAGYRGWTFGGGKNFLERMRRDGLVDENGRVTAASGRSE